MPPGRSSLSDFRITQAELDALAGEIRVGGEPLDLTSMGRILVRARLASVLEVGPSALPAWMKDPSVRLWDPAGHWKAGDQTIVACWEPTGERYGMRVRVGSIVSIARERATIQLDGRTKPVTFATAKPGSPRAAKWRKTVEDEVAGLQQAPELEQRVEAALLTYGEQVFSQILEALTQDPRFICVSGQWYLAELAVAPSDDQMAALAWKMVGVDTPQPTEALALQLEPGVAPGAPGLFGLEFALRQHGELFRNTGTEQRASWTLAGPPPGPFTPKCAAYDPDTYDILCHPKRPAPPEVVARLWALNLLSAVM